jgi:hypothetical protein
MNCNNQIYWNEGIKNAMIDSRLITRWELGFRRSIFENVQAVLGNKVYDFVPDLIQLGEELITAEEKDDAEFDRMWNEDIPLC